MLKIISEAQGLRYCERALHNDVIPIESSLPTVGDRLSGIVA